MINKVGYTDNRTSFGAYFKADQNGCFSKLYSVTVSSNVENAVLNALESAKVLRKKTPNHELEIIKLTEGTTQGVVIRNNTTGAYTKVEQQGRLAELFPNMVQKLHDMYKLNSAFWSEKTPEAKLYQLLTGQKNVYDAIV